MTKENVDTKTPEANTEENTEDDSTSKSAELGRGATKQNGDEIPIQQVSLKCYQYPVSVL